MTFPSIKEIVERYQLVADRSLGQNFLYDLELTSKIVEAAGDISDRDILEIGPGAGSLSRPILAKNISRLTSLEIDPRCIKALSYLKKFYKDKFNLLETNALKFKIKEHFQKKIIILANLPYNISTELFFRWIEEVDYIDRMVLMFQKEVALRLIAKIGDNNYGKLSIISELFFESRIYMDLDPELFYPSPKVTSSVVVFKARLSKYSFDYRKINNLLTVSFNQRRKKLKNRLIKTIPNIDELFEKYSINPNARAEELSATDFVNLSKHV